MNSHWSSARPSFEHGATAFSPAAAPIEYFRLWLLGPNRNLAARMDVEGDRCSVPLSPGHIAQLITSHQAVYLFMAHSHPSGEARPSAQDIEVTRMIWRLARLHGASLQDHYILGRSGWFSFRANGLL